MKPSIFKRLRTDIGPRDPDCRLITSWRRRLVEALSTTVIIVWIAADVWEQIPGYLRSRL